MEIKEFTKEFTPEQLDRLYKKSCSAFGELIGLVQLFGQLNKESSGRDFLFIYEEAVKIATHSVRDLMVRTKQRIDGE
jgi:hypothetical protein